jgi:ornithine cyclodeaminase
MNDANLSSLVRDADQTREALPYPALCDAISSILKLHRAGRVIAPERLVVSLGGSGALLLMPASDGRYAIAKLVTVHPTNPGMGLPTIQGEVIVFEAGTGRRLGILDGVAVTARRTAALSALAARTLAPEPSGALLVIGAGTQARSHLEAFREVLAAEKVYIHSRSRGHAEILAAYAGALGYQAEVTDDPERYLKEVTLIVTATNSPTPVLDGRELRQDAMVAAVGAFTPSMAELPARLVRRCRLYVDTLEGARAEAGDYIQAGVDWTQVQTLADALDHPAPGSGPVIFKSVGHAVFDLAAARLVFT